jgi:hypothetical protein
MFCKLTIYLTSTTFIQICNEIVKDDQLKHIQKGYNYVQKAPIFTLYNHVYVIVFGNLLAQVETK